MNNIISHLKIKNINKMNNIYFTHNNIIAFMGEYHRKKMSRSNF